MGIIKIGKNTDRQWYGVRCDCCGREAFNEASKEDAIDAVRNSGWAVLSSGEMPMKDYCPECREALMQSIAERRKAFR